MKIAREERTVSIREKTVNGGLHCEEVLGKDFPRPALKRSWAKTDLGH